MERLLPGFARELAAAGAPRLDAAADRHSRFAAGWPPRFDSGVVFHAVSRGLLECLLRRRVAALPHVTGATARRVVGFEGDAVGRGTGGHGRRAERLQSGLRSGNIGVGVFGLGPGAVGEAPRHAAARPGGRLRWLHGYLERTTAPAVSDRRTCLDFPRVLHLMAKPFILFGPRTARRVPRRVLRRGGRTSGNAG